MRESLPNAVPPSPRASSVRRWLNVAFFALIIAAAMLHAWQHRRVGNLQNRLDQVRLNPLDLTIDADPVGDKIQRVPVALIGDSRAAMWTELPQVAGASRNFGVSGHTTAQILARYAIEVKLHKPEIVVIVAGVNDLAIASDSAERRQEIEKQAEWNLRRLVTLARDDGCQVIITTVFGIGELPIRRRLDWPADFDANRNRFNQFIRTLAGPGVIILEAEAALQTGDKVDAPVLADFIHLNDKGYDRLNQKIEPLLRQLREQRPGKTP